MNNEIIQTADNDQKTQTGHAESDKQSVQVYRPRRWMGISATAGIVVGGVSGFTWLLWAAQAFSDTGDAVKFITEGSIALALLLVAAAQACVYWSQRRIMTAQWDAM